MRKCVIKGLLCPVISIISSELRLFSDVSPQNLRAQSSPALDEVLTEVKSVPSSHTGLDAELYYVRHDVVNHYALSFNMSVPTETNSLYFTWYSKTKVRPSRACSQHTGHLITHVREKLTFLLRSSFKGWLPAFIQHGEPRSPEPAMVQHLPSGGSAPCSLWSVKYSPFNF